MATLPRRRNEDDFTTIRILKDSAKQLESYYISSPWHEKMDKLLNDIHRYELLKQSNQNIDVSEPTNHHRLLLEGSVKLSSTERSRKRRRIFKSTPLPGKN